MAPALKARKLGMREYKGYVSTNNKIEKSLQRQSPQISANEPESSHFGAFKPLQTCPDFLGT